MFTSSIAVYGAGQIADDARTLLPQPEDPYGIAKYAVEQDLRAAHGMFGLDYVIFRPHNVYGEFQNIGDRYRNVVGIFMNQSMHGEPLTVFGDGEQTRAFSYIGDVAPYIAASVDVPAACNEVFNIGADQPFSVNELAEARGRGDGGRRRTIRHLPARNEVVRCLRGPQQGAARVRHVRAPVLAHRGAGADGRVGEDGGPARGAQVRRHRARAGVCLRSGSRT